MPEIGVPEFTEIRLVRRPFPKDPPERACYQFLLERMRAAPDRPQEPKAEIERTCRRRFRVTVDSFEYAWREAIQVTGARWDRPGRRPR